VNYYERHIGDYLKDTSHLSLLEHGVYARLLDVYYTRESALPSALIARLIGARSKDELAALNVVLLEFFIATEAGDWLQVRCDREIAVYQKKVAHNREVGKLGGRPRKVETQQEPPGLSVGWQTEPTRNPLQSPDTRHQTPEKKGQEIKTRAFALPEDVSPAVFSDWQALRRAKKAPITATAIDGIRREAHKAGITLESALAMACERGWTGFKAEWLVDRGGGANGVNKQSSLEARNKAVADSFRGSV